MPEGPQTSEKVILGQGDGITFGGIVSHRHARETTEGRFGLVARASIAQASPVHLIEL